MLQSIALMLLLGMALGWLCKKVKLPGLVGMIATGMILGPYGLGWLDSSILDISSQLRRIALIIILLRAGLSLNLEDLKKAGRPAILMCFVPACFEVTGMIILAPILLGVSRLDAAIMGAVVGAVSPAVIVPRMIKLTEEGWGTKKSIPQLILAGASVDDVFVIVLFSAFTGIALGDGVSAASFVKVPFSVLFGGVAGFAVGYVLSLYFERVHIRDTAKVMILLSISFLLVTAEDRFGETVPFSGLLAVMGMGIALKRKRAVVAVRLSSKFNKLWVMAEIMLYQDDEWKELLSRFGFFLGKFIYLMDAYEDIEDDLKNHNYNPLKQLYKKPEFEDIIHKILTMMMAECSKTFEQLPLIDDIDILRNVLYSGVWYRYEQVREKREKEKEENNV